MMQFAQPQFWVAIIQIVWINILLSGDNAVVIALACRDLPRPARRWGMAAGAGAAAILRAVFTAPVSELMRLPYLRLIGACALVLIAIRLLTPSAHEPESNLGAASDVWHAMRMIVVADIVMSLDNVVAIAAVARGDYLLLGLGLAISIPIVIAGSASVLALTRRFPAFIWAGAALLGWVAGQLLLSDPVISARLDVTASATVGVTSRLAGALGAAAVLLAGFLRRHWTARR